MRQKDARCCKTLGGPAHHCTSSWTRPVKVTGHGNTRSTRVSFPSFRPKAIALNHGNMIGKCTGAETKLSACFAASKASAASFSRFEKLDAMFLAFINFALIVDGIRSCEQAIASRWTGLLEEGQFAPVPPDTISHYIHGLQTD